MQLGVQKKISHKYIIIIKKKNIKLKLILKKTTIFCPFTPSINKKKKNIYIKAFVCSFIIFQI